MENTLQFFANFKEAQREGRWLTFRNEIILTLKKQLYVRKSYESLFAHLSRSGRRKYVTVTGTPGIGKSVCVYYLLWALAQRKSRVLALFKGTQVYFDGTSFFDFHFPLPRDFVWSTDLWCIVDSQDPTRIKGLKIDMCSVVLITTPRDDIISAFQKLIPIPVVFYMPLWSFDESEALAARLYSSNTSWERRFEVLGGVPRLVFEDTKEKDPVKILQNACTKCDLDDCIRVIGLDTAFDSKAKLVQSLIHIDSKSPYSDCIVNYASETALKLIVQCKGREACGKMESLLQSCAGNPLAASLCGYIFEPYAFRKLQSGGKFVCRDLVSGRGMQSKPEDYEVEIKCSGRKVVDGVGSRDKHGLLHVPMTKNYTQMDAWIPGFGAFQMTVGRTNSLTAEIEPDLEKIGGKLFWVLPPLFFDAFTKKSPMRIEQSALKIPYPQVFEIEDAGLYSNSNFKKLS